MTRRKSKELVPIASKEVAIPDEKDDPTPLWTMSVRGALLKVQAVGVELYALAKDREASSDDRKAGTQYLTKKLTNEAKHLSELVDKMDSGDWMDGRETLPDPEPAEQETIPLAAHAPARAIDELLSPDWQAKWDAMDLEKRLAWSKEATGNER